MMQEQTQPPGKSEVPSISMLRIYLRRRAARPRPGLRGWFTRKPVATLLVEEALKLGVTYGTVTLGHSGFVHDARRVEQNNTEIPTELLPTCVELVGEREVLDAFVDAFTHELFDAVLIRLDGIGYRLHAPDSGDAGT